MIRKKTTTTISLTSSQEARIREIERTQTVLLTKLGILNCGTPDGNGALNVLKELQTDFEKYKGKQFRALILTAVITSIISSHIPEVVVKIVDLFKELI